MDLKKIPKKSDVELLNSLLREINLQIRKAQETQDYYHGKKMKILALYIRELLDQLRRPKDS